MTTINTSENVIIKYDQNKLILKSKSLRLDMNISMSELFSIYSSGEGSGSARFTFNIPDDYQKKSEEIPKPVVQKKKKML